VSAGQQVIAISCGDEFEVSLNLSESVIGSVNEDTPVSISFGAIANMAFTGRVSEIAVASAGNQAVFPVVIKVVESHAALRSGLAADVTFQFDTSALGNGIVVPVAAIMRSPEGTYVFIAELDKDNEALVTRRSVTLGELSQSGIEILDGLVAGDRVITAGLSVIREGQRVPAIDKNRITITVVVLVILSGIMAFQNIPKAQDPGFIVRTAVITTRFPGASPERVEQLVTEKIEEKVQEMPEIDSIISESRTGISIINVNFKESYKIMRPIFDDMRRKVDSVVEDLPQGAMTPEVNDEFGDVFGSVYTLVGDGFSYAELKTVADELRDTLLKEPDIAKVNIHGAQQEVIFVEYSNSRLSELGLSPQQLSAALAGVNILSSGGDIIF